MKIITHSKEISD